MFYQFREALKKKWKMLFFFLFFVYFMVFKRVLFFNRFFRKTQSFFKWKLLIFLKFVFWIFLSLYFRLQILSKIMKINKKQKKTLIWEYLFYFITQKKLFLRIGTFFDNFWKVHFFLVKKLMTLPPRILNKYKFE